MVDQPRSAPPEGRPGGPEERAKHRRLKIVHESLLREWPRLEAMILDLGSSPDNWSM